jgi:hypothetical protein
MKPWQLCLARTGLVVTTVTDVCEQAHVFREIAKRKTMRAFENSVELLLMFPRRRDEKHNSWCH